MEAFKAIEIDFSRISKGKYRIFYQSIGNHANWAIENLETAKIAKRVQTPEQGLKWLRKQLDLQCESSAEIVERVGRGKYLLVQIGEKWAIQDKDGTIVAKSANPNLLARRLQAALSKKEKK